jgi:hypothetical protein
LNAGGPQPEAPQHSFEITSLFGIGAFSLPTHRLPAIEKCLCLVAGPAEFIENLVPSCIHRSPKMFDGEVGRVAGVFQILRSPLRFA